MKNQQIICGDITHKFDIDTRTSAPQLVILVKTQEGRFSSSHRVKFWSRTAWWAHDHLHVDDSIFLMGERRVHSRQDRETGEWHSSVELWPSMIRELIEPNHVNKVDLLGIVDRMPIKYETKTKETVLTFSLRTWRKIGETYYDDRHLVTVFGAGHLRIDKNGLVAVSGRNVTNYYQGKYQTKVIAEPDNVQVMGTYPPCQKKQTC